MKRRVAEAWQSFEEGVLPRNCSDVQRQEMRRAFFAGAFATLDTISAAMSNEDEMTSDDEQVMIDLAEERKEYLRNLLTGRA